MLNDYVLFAMGMTETAWVERLSGPLACVLPPPPFPPLGKGGGGLPEDKTYVGPCLFTAAYEINSR